MDQSSTLLAQQTLSRRQSTTDANIWVTFDRGGRVGSVSGYAYGGHTFGYGHKAGAGFGLTFLDDSGRAHEAGPLRSWPAYMTIGNNIAAFGQERHAANSSTRSTYFAIDFVGDKVLRIPGSLAEIPIVTGTNEMIIHRQGTHGEPATNEIIAIK